MSDDDDFWGTENPQYNTNPQFASQDNPLRVGFCCDEYSMLGKVIEPYQKVDNAKCEPEPANDDDELTDIIEYDDNIFKELETHLEAVIADSFTNANIVKGTKCVFELSNNPRTLKRVYELAKNVEIQELDKTQTQKMQSIFKNLKIHIGRPENGFDSVLFASGIAILFSGIGFLNKE